MIHQLLYSITVVIFHQTVIFYEIKHGEVTSECLQCQFQPNDEPWSPRIFDQFSKKVRRKKKVLQSCCAVGWGQKGP
jgi:hypothetical protein